MVKSILRVILCLCLILPALKAPETLEAQNQDGESSSRTNVLYRIRFDEDFYFLAQEAGPHIWENYSGPFPDKDYWYYSLEINLGHGSHIAQVMRCPEGVDPLEEAAAKRVPVIVDIMVNGEFEKPYTKVQYTIRDMYSDLHSIEKTFEESIPTEEDLLSYFWLPLARDLEELTETIFKPSLVIHGPPGALVYGITENILRIPDSGTLNLAVSMPQTFGWSMVHEKYAFQQGVFLADQEHSLLELPQQRFYPLTVDFSLSWGLYPELWVSWAPKPAGWFFSLGLEQREIGFFLSDNEEAPYTSFNRRPLIIPGIAGGYFFRAPAFQPKLYLRGGFSLCVEYEIPRLDEFSPFSVDFALGYDWETPAKIRLFAEAGISFRYLHPDFTGSLALGKESLGYVQVLTGDVGLLELPRIRVGFKVPVY